MKWWYKEIKWRKEIIFGTGKKVPKGILHLTDKLEEKYVN